MFKHINQTKCAEWFCHTSKYHSSCSIPVVCTRVKEWGSIKVANLVRHGLADKWDQQGPKTWQRFNLAYIQHMLVDFCSLPIRDCISSCPTIYLHETYLKLVFIYGFEMYLVTLISLVGSQASCTFEIIEMYVSLKWTSLCGWQKYLHEYSQSDWWFHLHHISAAPRGFIFRPWKVIAGEKDFSWSAAYFIIRHQNVYEMNDTFLIQSYSHTRVNTNKYAKIIAAGSLQERERNDVAIGWRPCQKDLCK